MTDTIYETLGRRVRARREELGLTQAELSATLELSRASIANIEAGRQKVLLHQFLALAATLTVEPMDLIPSSLPTKKQPALPEEVMRFMNTYKTRRSRQ